MADLNRKEIPSDFFSKERRHASKKETDMPMQLDSDVLNGQKRIHLDAEVQNRKLLR